MCVMDSVPARSSTTSFTRAAPASEGSGGRMRTTTLFFLGGGWGWGSMGGSLELD